MPVGAVDHQTPDLWTSGPLDLGTRGTFSHLSLSNFGCPISAPSSFPLLVPTRPALRTMYGVAAHHMQLPRPPLPCHTQVTHNVVYRTAPTTHRTTAQRTARYPRISLAHVLYSSGLARSHLGREGGNGAAGLRCATNCTAVITTVGEQETVL